MFLLVSKDVIDTNSLSGQPASVNRPIESGIKFNHSVWKNKVYCDLKSWLYLKGVQVDFSEDMLSGGFQIVNPNAKRTCGCGTSFSV